MTGAALPGRGERFAWRVVATLAGAVCAFVPSAAAAIGAVIVHVWVLDVIDEHNAVSLVTTIVTVCWLRSLLW